MSATPDRILILSFVEWGGAFQRPHHLAVGLARRGGHVTYASPGFLHRRGTRVDSGLELPERLRIVEPVALPGSSRLGAIEQFNHAAMHRALYAESGEQPWDLLIFNDPRMARLARRLPARQRIFDCMDDLSAESSSGDISNDEAAALALADRVWTGTWSLAEKLGDGHVSVRFIPCGVDAEMFAAAADGDARDEDAEIDAQLPPGDGPLAGYFGMLNERFDMGAVEALLQVQPWRVLLIGPTTTRAPRLPAHPRLRWIGPRPYRELPAWLRRFDLALIPYDTQGPHRFLYPVKALEYLAGGKPVLSTPLPDVVRFLGDFVGLAATPDQWRAAARELRDNPTAWRERTLAGQRHAATRSWDAMVDEMLEDIAGPAHVG